MPKGRKSYIQRQHEDFAEAHENNVLVEMKNTNEPPSWMRRVERLYRETVIPRLEAKAAKAALSDIERQVLAKARAYLAAEGTGGGA